MLTVVNSKVELTLSNEAIAAIKQLAPKHHATATAPNSIHALREWGKLHVLNVDSLSVYDGGSDSTIFGTCAGNYAFRAWHDAIHLENGYGFSLDDECEVAAIHCKELRLMGVSEDDIDLLFADVTGQVLYYYHNREYISNQVDFHIALLKDCANVVKYKQ